jgi:hypothetical protein
VGFDDLADLSTVEEAARFLRIGRGMAYRAARRYVDTGGEQGLPVIELGRHLRVPKLLLLRLLTGELRLDGPAPAAGTRTTRSISSTSPPDQAQLRLIDGDSA